MWWFFYGFVIFEINLLVGWDVIDVGFGNIFFGINFDDIVYFFSLVCVYIVDFGVCVGVVYNISI